MIGLAKRRKVKLPFLFGTNSQRIVFPQGAADTTALNAQVAAGMVIDRNELPTNFTKAGSTFTGLMSAPGVYNEPNISAVAAVAATLKAAGQTPLFLLSNNQSPALCAMLTTALTTGQTGVTTIGVTKVPFAIAIGDTIVLTDPANQAHTQTLTAQSAITKGASGTLTVTSFNPDFNFPGFVASTTNPPVLGTAGAWIYDSTSWPGCTPQHMADLAVHLVSNAGLKGCRWELCNEPDGITWGTDAMLVTQMYKLAYARMKAADSTCIVHGIVIENTAPIGFPEGTAYYELCVQAGILGSYDALSLHEYSYNPNGKLDLQPDLPNTFGKPYWKMLADFQKIRVGLGDNTPIWVTEFGWKSGFRTTVAAGSNGVDVTTFTGAATLSVGSTTNWDAAGTVYAQTSLGTAKCSYTSIGAGVLNGVTYVSGDKGTLSTGGTVTGGIETMNWQLQAQYFSDLLAVLSGWDPINNVKFSTYLQAMVQFQFAASFQEWRVYDTTNGPKTAYGTIQRLILGT